MAICDADSLLMAHCIWSPQDKLPNSISCIDVPYAALTAGQGSEVASLSANMVCSNAF